MWGVFIMGKLKKITALNLASTMILTGQSVFAETNNNNISVVVDGSELTFDTQYFKKFSFVHRQTSFV